MRVDRERPAQHRCRGARACARSAPAQKRLHYRQIRRPHDPARRGHHDYIYMVGKAQAFSAGTANYGFNVRHGEVTIDIARLGLQRLDVKLPQVTLADGTTVTVGRASATLAVFGDLPPPSFELPGGLDLPPGGYTVKVSYVHPASQMAITEAHVVTLP